MFFSFFDMVRTFFYMLVHDYFFEHFFWGKILLHAQINIEHRYMLLKYNKNKNKIRKNQGDGIKNVEKKNVSITCRYIALHVAIIILFSLLPLLLEPLLLISVLLLPPLATGMTWLKAISAISDRFLCWSLNVFDVVSSLRNTTGDAIGSLAMLICSVISCVQHDVGYVRFISL